MSLLAFIPARGGSKGIPRKNLALLDGKPLIQYTVEAAMHARCVDEIFLSSDDKEIIDFCRSLGLKTIYRRPDELSGDAVSMVDVILDLFSWKREQGEALPDEFLLLQPTSPLRTASHIEEAVAQFRKEGADTLVSVHYMTEHPFECVKQEDDDWHFLATPPENAIRRQDYAGDFFFINGAIYLVRSKFFLREKKLIEQGRSSLYVMDSCYGVDIDAPFDLLKAEFLQQTQRNAIR